jgi:lysophospholipase
MLPDRQIGHVVRFDDYVEDFNTFVREVVAKRKHKRLLLLAHSMGGGIASVYLDRYPGDFAKAALGDVQVGSNDYPQLVLLHSDFDAC